MPDLLGLFLGRWRLEGWDTFSGHAYPIPGRFRTRLQAEKAAQRALRDIERMQPGAQSGGRNGVQDQVYIIDPDGRRTLAGAYGAGDSASD